MTPETKTLSRANEIKPFLREGVKTSGNQNRFSSAPGVRRIECTIPRMDLPAWLHKQNDEIKFYWQDRAGKIKIAALGSVFQITTHEASGFGPHITHMRSLYHNGNHRMRFFGGVSFHTTPKQDSAWSNFGYSQWNLPRIEITQTEVSTTLAFHLYCPNDPRAEYELDHLDFEPCELKGGIPSLLTRTDTPDKEAWKEGIEEALISFQHNTIDKIVLARKTTFAFSSPIEFITLLARLKQNAPQCYAFAFQPKKGFAFLGASPERLYARQARHIITEALAGTRPRGGTAMADDMWTKELLTCDKDIREHGWVIRGIRESLTNLCSEFEEDKAVSVLKLASGQHLLYQFSGQLKRQVSDADIIVKLSPTPAVGGYPKNLALSMITKTEPFERGWYAGGIGWIGYDEAELAVGIRSGLIEGDKLHLFSGAGIVKGSLPDAEWDEIEHKIGTFTKILNNELTS